MHQLSLVAWRLQLIPVGQHISRLFSSFSFLFKLFICYVFEKKIAPYTDFAWDFVYDLLLRTSRGMEQDCSNPQVYPQSAKRVGHTHILLWEWSDPSIYPLTSSMEPMTSWRVGLSDQGGELAQLHIVERMDGNISHWESFAKEVCSISRSLKAWLVASCSSNSCAKLASSVCTLCFGSILIQLLLFAKTMFCHLGLSYARALEIVAPTCRPNRSYVCRCRSPNHTLEALHTLLYCVTPITINQWHIDWKMSCHLSLASYIRILTIGHYLSKSVHDLEIGLILLCIQGQG